MAPSKESQYLATLFTQLSQLFPADGDPTRERIVYDKVQDAATEATDVVYEDVELPGEYRGPAKWVRPLQASKTHVVLFLHGGGYSFGSLNSHRKLCAHLAKACNAQALMVDYRMTPEHAFPAALDDCVRAYKWLISQGFEGKHIAIAGDSCGGGLATTVPLKILRDGLAKPGASVALSPWYDCVNADSESLHYNADKDKLGTIESIKNLAKKYTAGGASRDDPLISAIYAEPNELSKLPPTWISCGGYDTLLDDGTRMAAKLGDCGVDVVVKVHEGMQHVFEFMAGRAPEANKSLEEIGTWVRKQIESQHLHI